MSDSIADQETDTFVQPGQPGHNQGKEVVWERWQKKRTFVRALEGTYGEVYKSLFDQPRDIGPAGQRLDLEGAGPGLLCLIHQVQRRTADRTGRTQHRHAPPDHPVRPAMPAISRPQATTTTANIRPSTRSSKPP